MTLKQQVKKTKTRSSQMYAIVEMATLGRATVVLLGSSQRMTNLPVYGKSVTTGDKVVVDYSSEGIPYVRVAIQYDDEVDQEPLVILNEALVDNNDGFMAGKVILTSDNVFSGSIVGDTFSWTPILFDKVLYDNLYLWNNTAGYFSNMPTGQYLVNVNLGFQVYSNGGPGFFAVQVINYKASTGALTPTDFRIPYSHDLQAYNGIEVINFTTLARISDTDEGIGLAFCAYASGYIYPEVLKDYSAFSVHKLKNLSLENEQAIRGYWDTSGTYF